jgi:hypothetical protein
MLVGNGTNEFRAKRHQRSQRLPCVIRCDQMRRLQLQHQQRDHNRQYAIAERFQPAWAGQCSVNTFYFLISTLYKSSEK